MPHLIDAGTDDACELGDLVETLETGRLDPRDEASFASFGEALRKLANNRDFLADIVVEELKNRCNGQVATNGYGPQVVMLHRSETFFIRANFWPSSDDAVVENNSAETFFYHVPHDHNFSFLTAGYFGPGYWSDYYEYDYGAVRGIPGEAVALRAMGRSRLEEGQVMLYRAHRDVHAQLPADSLSVSLNVMELSSSLPYRDQYRFDTTRGVITEIMTLSAIEPLLALCAHVGNTAALDLVADFASHHPSDRIQFAALKAQASAVTDIDARLEVFERGGRCGNDFVSRMSVQQVEAIGRGRNWLERGTSQREIPC